MPLPHDRNSAITWKEKEMFVVNELAVKAENNYRRELLRDQYQNGKGTVAKASTLVVVASLVLAACGAAAPTESADADRRDVVAQVSDPGPEWQPDETALNTVLNGVEVLGFSVEAENTGVWGEDADRLQSVLSELAKASSYADERSTLSEFLNGTNEATEHFKSFEPQGDPNYARLETYLGDGSNDPSGPR